MPFHVKHWLKKAILYGTLLAALVVLTLSMAISGVGLPMALFIYFGLVISGVLAYILINPLSLWRVRARIPGRQDELRLRRITGDLCKARGLKMPLFALVPGPVPDVFSGGASRARSIIFITPGLLAEFNDAELKAILEQEIDSIDGSGSFVYNLAVNMASGLWAIITRLRISKALDDGSVEIGDGDPRLVIKKARLSDVPYVARSLIDHGMYSHFSLHDLNRMAREGSPLFLMAYYGGMPAGFAISEINGGVFGGTGHLCKIIVDSAHQRKGIGKSLMHAFMRVTIRLGCDRCLLEVRADNAKAISLYEQFEFQKEAIMPRYFPDGADGLRMTKSLHAHDKVAPTPLLAHR